jgi:hypothetical protein
MDEEFERQLGPDFLFKLRTAGYDFDLLQDHALATRARVEDGRLRAGTAAFSVVVVPAVRLMPPDALARLAGLAQAGGHLVFVERVPQAAPGLADQEARSAEVRRIVERLFGSAEPTAGVRSTAGGGSVALVPDEAAAFARLGAVLPPDFRIVASGDSRSEAPRSVVETVGFLHRRAGALDYYLVANVSPEERALRVQLSVGHRAPVRWDAAAGLSSALAYDYVRPGGHAATEVELRLDPFESCFVVFGPSADPPTVTRTPFVGPWQLVSRVLEARIRGGSHAVGLPGGVVRGIVATDVPDPVAVEGPWTLRLGPEAVQPLPRLVSWNELPGGATYSGWATYETGFDVPELGRDVEWQLDLGLVHETAEVTLNGQALGAAWKRPRRLECGGALRAGRNELRVDVANLWIHHMAAQPPPTEWKAVEETFGIRWGRYGEVMAASLPPSGLLGPVRLVPLRRVRLTI